MAERRTAKARVLAEFPLASAWPPEPEIFHAWSIISMGFPLTELGTGEINGDEESAWQDAASKLTKGK